VGRSGGRLAIGPCEFSSPLFPRNAVLPGEIASHIALFGTLALAGSSLSRRPHFSHRKALSGSPKASWREREFTDVLFPIAREDSSKGQHPGARHV
jgi:hypothetical protein